MLTVESLTVLGYATTAYGYLDKIKDAYDNLQDLLNMFEESMEEKLRKGFEQLRNELQEMQQDLRNLIQSSELRLQYAGCEDKIWWALDYFVTYLQDMGSQYKKGKFVEKGEPLRDAVRTLMEGLLGQRILRVDILATIVELEKKRPGRIRERVRSFVQLVNAGIMLHSAYVQVSENPEADYGEIFASLYGQMTARIDEEIARCEKEDEVPNEMVNIMDSFTCFDRRRPDKERDALAEKIHRHLSERYDTRQWLVIVFGTDCFLEPDSPGWHCPPSEVKGRRAFAKSFPLNGRDEPHPFQAPSRIPLRELSWPFHLLTFLNDSDLICGCMDELAREMFESQPANTYLVLRTHFMHSVTVKVSFGGVSCEISRSPDPVIKSKNSSLMREVKVGRYYKVIACPR